MDELSRNLLFPGALPLAWPGSADKETKIVGNGLAMPLNPFLVIFGVVCHGVCPITSIILGVKLWYSAPRCRGRVLIFSLTFIDIDMTWNEKWQVWWYPAFCTKITVGMGPCLWDHWSGEMEIHLPPICCENQGVCSLTHND